MSFYRKLIIDEMEYQYHVGENFVKIKGLKGKNDIPFSEICLETPTIKPKMIRDYIKGEKNHISNYFQNCNCKNVEKHVRILPYQNEIENKTIYVYYCAECIANNAADI